MIFRKALEGLKAGKAIKRSHWTGYWMKSGDTVTLYCKCGKTLDIRETEDVMYTLENIAADDWEIIDDSRTPEQIVTTFGFGEAIRRMKLGEAVARKGWNGKGMFVVYQKAYPQGIPCNAQTAKAWGLNEGDLFKCEPYFQIKMVNGSHAMWVPSINDCLAEDWVVAEKK